MTFSFTLRNADKIKALLKKAKSEAAKIGVSLIGNDKQGTFAGNTPLGKLAGTYQYKSSSFAVTIVEKPLLISDKMIQKAIREFKATV
jgi:hypothetical protein